MQFWYKSSSILAWILLPLSGLFAIVSYLRRAAYRRGYLKSYRPPLPVVVVGNITVGGNGKTPVVIALVQQLTALGLKVGIISRGYGGKHQQLKDNKKSAILVVPSSEPSDVGDEPVLIAQRTALPVAISPNRQASIELLLQQNKLDLILTDDGLQHYALQRDMEIVVIDGERRFGNQHLLPAGPLRESIARLENVDACICNGGNAENGEIQMQLLADKAVNLVTKEVRPLQDFVNQSVVAMAGIGHPPRFFNTLKQHGIQPQQCHAFMDHQRIELEKLNNIVTEEQVLLMTEKDAVKYHSNAQDNWWYVPVEAQFSSSITALLEKIQQKVKIYEQNRT